MNKYKIKIKKIEIFKDIIKIISNDDIIFISKIIKGSINFKIYNNIFICNKNEYEEVGLNNLEINDIIIIYGINNYDKNNINNILIKKIKIKNKYNFTSESSSENMYY